MKAEPSYVTRLIRPVLIAILLVLVLFRCAGWYIKLEDALEGHETPVKGLEVVADTLIML